MIRSTTKRSATAGEQLPTAKKELYLYIHIPFCKVKCSYCAFYTVSALDKASDFERAVLRCIDNFDFEPYYLASIYFGGGTPSLLPECVGRIISYLTGRVEISPHCEITLEANPESVSPKTLEILAKSGVNRLSIGVQSSDDKRLIELGRGHSFAQAVDAFYMARVAGFKNISVDILLAVENQTVQQAMDCVRRIAELQPEHISAYLLKIEPNTRLARREVALPDDDISAEIYLSVSDFLVNLGYEHYEVSSFAGAGYRAVHNSAYWSLKDYLGLGPSAHSCIDGVRYYMPSSIDIFTNSNNPLELMYQSVEPACGMDEKIMLALRTSNGMEFDKINCDSGQLSKLNSFIQLLIEQGMAKNCKASQLVLTPKGFLVSNSITAEILEILGI